GQYRHHAAAAEIVLIYGPLIRAHPRREQHVGPGRAEPHGLVGARSAGPVADLRPPVRTGHDGALGPHDDIGHHIADDERPSAHARRWASCAESATAIW